MIGTGTDRALVAQEKKPSALNRFLAGVLGFLGLGSDRNGLRRNGAGHMRDGKEARKRPAPPAGVRCTLCGPRGGHVRTERHKPRPKRKAQAS